MNKDKLKEILKKHHQISGLKESLIKSEDDYFKQAVIIVAGLPESLQEDIAEDLDDFFKSQGYKEGALIKAVYEYQCELEALYKRIIGVE